MKNIRVKIAILAAGIVMAVSLTGCEELLGQLLGSNMTISQRIAAFETDINATTRSWETIIANFGPEADMTYYSAAKYDSYWDEAFPSAYTYSFTVTSSSNPLAVTVAGIKKNSSGNTIEEPTYTFRMYQEASGNYLIQEIWESGVADPIIKAVDF